MSLFTQNPEGGTYHDPNKPVGAILYDKQQMKANQKRKGLFQRIKLLQPWKRRKAGTSFRVKKAMAAELIKAGVAEDDTQKRGPGRPRKDD